MKNSLVFYTCLLFSLILVIAAQRDRAVLPKKLKIGYANYAHCDEKIFEAVQNGLNVIIWFQIDLGATPDKSKPAFLKGPDYSCVAKMVEKIKKHKYKVVHLISAGGWNSPHVNTNFTAMQYFKEWVKFNEKISTEYFKGFDGIDWDIEGNDDLNSTDNHFTYKELDIIGQFSRILKRNGYIVTMVPPESYLDASTSEFSLSLTHNYPEWEKEVPNFTYHARNVYAYLIAKYSIKTFDLVMVQLYEGYAHALYKFEREKKPFGEIMEEYVTNLTRGYIVDFSSDPKSGLGKKRIKIPANKLTLGLANGWAEGKFLFVGEKSIVKGYKYLKSKRKKIRGFFFWNIKDEGKVPLSKNKENDEPFYLAKVLNSIL